METERNDKRHGWLSFSFDEALRLGVMQPADILTHATPEVLAGNLPRFARIAGPMPGPVWESPSSPRSPTP